MPIISLTLPSVMLYPYFSCTTTSMLYLRRNSDGGGMWILFMCLGKVQRLAGENTGKGEVTVGLLLGGTEDTPGDGLWYRCR